MRLFIDFKLLSNTTQSSTSHRTVRKVVQVTIKFKTNSNDTLENNRKVSPSSSERVHMMRKLFTFHDDVHPSSSFTSNESYSRGKFDMLAKLLADETSHM